MTEFLSATMTEQLSQSSEDDPAEQSETTTTSTTETKKVRLTKKEKKEQKLAKRRQKMLENRPLERARRKEKKKEKKKAIAQGIADGAAPPISKKRKLEDVTMSPNSMIIDLEFDDEMTNAEVVSLGTQIRHSYGMNKNAEHPWNFYWTGFGGKLKAEIEKNIGWDRWKMMTIHEKNYIDVFPPDKLVYLTADSPNVIETIDPSKIYIIGGIVDHNRLKAKEQNIETAQLPISKYLHLNSRKVLTVNQIVEILLNYDATKDWEAAFMKTIPQRKLEASSRESETTNNTNDSDAKEIELDDGEL